MLKLRFGGGRGEIVRVGTSKAGGANMDRTVTGARTSQKSTCGEETRVVIVKEIRSTHRLIMDCHV
ncbi:uncharacterized protein EI90DRAFT_3052041, partial [Cantharellus anzutake]|uniref:uncharacterized protein n=1 Tax=Cantharellus anzutake TaxID=1750568 RepID=UPI0019043040